MFWLALGATAGVLVVRKVTKAAQALTPAGLGRRADGLGEALRYFADEVRAGMEEREAELRDALGIDQDGHDLAPDEAADVIERPTSMRRTSP